MRDKNGSPREQTLMTLWLACALAAAALCFDASLETDAQAQSVPLAGVSGSQRATTGFDGVTRRVLERHDVPGSDSEMVLVEVTFPPGRAAPVHHHPVAGLVYILEGTAESAYGNDPPRAFRAGDTLQDQAAIPHTVFRNTDPNEPLRFLIFYAAQKGQPYLVTP